MEELLHPEFEEFGQSGCEYSGDESLLEFGSETHYPRVVATDFEISELGGGVV
jgi:hypothetical protein